MLSRKRKFTLLFLLQVFLTFEFNAFFPALKICFFIPLLAFLMYELSFIRLIWISMLAGLFLDLVGAQYAFGAYSLTLTLSAAICYRLKKTFFKDKILTLAIVTTAISFCNEFFITTFFKMHGFSLLSRASFLTDFVSYPLIEGFVAFILFTAPQMLAQHFKWGKKEKRTQIATRKRPN